MNKDGPWIEVVGVAKDGKYITFGESSVPYFFLSLARITGAASPSWCVPKKTRIP